MLQSERHQTHSMFAIPPFQQRSRGTRCSNGEGRSEKDEGHLEDRLYTFLARYRVTSQGTTRRAPAEFLLKTPPLTRLDLLRPTVQDRVLRRQAYDKQRHDTRSAIRTFRAGDLVWALNFQVLENQLGPLTCTVRLSDGRLWKHHQDHLRERRHDETEEVGAEERPAVVQLPPSALQPTVTNSETCSTDAPSTTNDWTSASVPQSPVPGVGISSRTTATPRKVTSPMRRSTRVAKPPVRLDL